MSYSMPRPTAHPGGAARDVHPYANGIAALALAAMGAAVIGVSAFSSSGGGVWAIFVLGMGQALVFGLAGTLPLGYRVASAIALLAALTTAFVPHLLGVTPLAPVAAVALAAAGSLPMWAVAIWRLAVARRSLAAA